MFVRMRCHPDGAPASNPNWLLTWKRDRERNRNRTAGQVVYRVL